MPQGVKEVPWTYLEAVEPAAAAGEWKGQAYSASQRPLAAHRGRIEQVAIGLRHDPGDSILVLRSRMDKDKPLVGYSVFTQNADEKEQRLVGSTDSAGEAAVPPGKSAVQMMFVKSDGTTLARLPTVPGAVPRVEVSLPDDDVRLRAAARLSAYREDVIDLVARRNIFMARIHQAIDVKNFERARELLDSLDELPGQTQFNLALDAEARRLRTKDAQVQKRIDQLFADTRTAVGKFLDPRPIGKLHEDLRKAQQPADQASNEPEKKPS